jgi:hypothetical protein
MPRCPRSFPLPALLALLFAACATVPRVSVERHPSFDLAACNSFAFLPATSVAAPGTREDADRLVNRAREMTAARLASLGLRRVPIGEADLAVVIHGESIPRHGMEQWMVKNPATNPRGANWTAAAYLEVDAIRYDERTLRMEVYDTRTTQLVWVGWSRSTRRAPWPEDEVAAQLEAIVRAFPFARAPSSSK